MGIGGDCCQTDVVVIAVCEVLNDVSDKVKLDVACTIGSYLAAVQKDSELRMSWGFLKLLAA